MNRPSCVRNVVNDLCGASRASRRRASELSRALLPLPLHLFHDESLIANG